MDVTVELLNSVLSRAAVAAVSAQTNVAAAVSGLGAGATTSVVLTPSSEENKQPSSSGLYDQV